MKEDERSDPHPRSRLRHREDNLNLPAGMLSYLTAILACLWACCARRGLRDIFVSSLTLIETVRFSMIKANNSIFEMILAFDANDDNARLDGIQSRLVLLKLPRERSEATRRVKERKVTIWTCAPKNEFISHLAQAELNV